MVALSAAAATRGTRSASVVNVAASRMCFMAFPFAVALRRQQCARALSAAIGPWLITQTVPAHLVWTTNRRAAATGRVSESENFRFSSQGRERFRALHAAPVLASYSTSPVEGGNHVRHRKYSRPAREPLHPSPRKREARGRRR